MTGTIKFEFDNERINVSVDVQHVSAMDQMQAMHAMRDAIHMDEETFKAYVVCEHLGLLSPEFAVRMDGRLIDAMKDFGGADNEG